MVEAKTIYVPSTSVIQMFSIINKTGQAYKCEELIERLLKLGLDDWSTFIKYIKQYCQKAQIVFILNPSKTEPIKNSKLQTLQIKQNNEKQNEQNILTLPHMTLNYLLLKPNPAMFIYISGLVILPLLLKHLLLKNRYPQRGKSHLIKDSLINIANNLPESKKYSYKKP